MSETGPLTESDIDAILAVDTGCGGLIVTEAETVEDFIDQFQNIARAVLSEPHNKHPGIILLCWL